MTPVDVHYCSDLLIRLREMQTIASDLSPKDGEKLACRLTIDRASRTYFGQNDHRTTVDAAAFLSFIQSQIDTIKIELRSKGVTV